VITGETTVFGGNLTRERLIRPIAFERRTLRFDLPAITAASLALWLLALDGSLTRVEGVILGLGGAAYTAGIIWTSHQESAPVHADYASHSERTTSRGRRGLLLHALTVIAGIGLLLLGAEFLVDGSIEIARSLEVSEATIGLTVIALFTCAPSWSPCSPRLSVEIATLRQATCWARASTTSPSFSA
jgi:cation:H+ antiporter